MSTAVMHDQPEARALLQRAQGALQKWPEGFQGFRARVEGAWSAGEASGWVECGPGQPVRVDMEDPAIADRVADWLTEVVRDRTPHFFKDRDGRFPIRLDSEHREAAERRVWVDGPGGERRAYRIDSRVRIRAFERHRPDAVTVSTVEEYVRATPGRVLPARVHTRVWDASRGTVTHTETVADLHVRVEHVWLPASRTVTTEHRPGSYQLRLADHRLRSA